MTGIFGILESSATLLYQDVAPSQEFFFFIVASIVYASTPFEFQPLMDITFEKMAFVKVIDRKVSGLITLSKHAAKRRYK
jgi:hypothetical protein